MSCAEDEFDYTIRSDLRSRLKLRLDHLSNYSDASILEEIDMLLAEQKTYALSLREKTKLRMELFNAVRRLDILQELLDDDEITEIMINGPTCIFVEKQGKMMRWDRSFLSEECLEDVIRKIASSCNRIVNEQKPIADARLENGARVNIVLPPVSLVGPIVTIRRFPDDPICADDLVSFGSITKEAMEFLRELVEAKYTILVGGGTSTGKTTLLNALSGFIPKEERVITIEDNAELQLQGCENLVRLEARSGNIDGAFAVTMRDLVRTALRMRPDRLIIGEVRGEEAGDWLTSLNTGHAGSLGSAHANHVQDMIGRLESMVLMGIDLPIPVIRAQIASGIEILVHLKRDGNGRRLVDQISEIAGFENGTICLNHLFQRKNGILSRIGELHCTEKRDLAREACQRREISGEEAD